MPEKMMLLLQMGPLLIAPIALAALLLRERTDEWSLILGGLLCVLC